MNTSPTIGVLLAAGAILLPSCETERVNERPIGIYPTENVYPSGAVGAQGDSLLNDIQRENSLDPMAGQNSVLTRTPPGPIPGPSAIWWEGPTISRLRLPLCPSPSFLIP
ncbi:hypothetical protein M5E88_03260 [Akkermansia muciniphila]|nr:hypothetical protein M5E88_03260 [Akkermansia muciniphila]